MEKDLLNIEEISKKFNFTRITSELLFNRGYTSFDKINSFLYPKLSDFSKPYSLLNMDHAVSLFLRHVESKSKVLIYGDYDCDGIGAAAILYLAFKEHNINCEVFIPSREEDGYGLTTDSIKKVLNVYSPNLIITVDCGISSIKEVEYIKSKGVDIIITDHHVPGDIIPNCIVVNPKIQKYSHDLSGAGIAFHFINALFGIEFATRFLDICAISTIADLVPLIGDNRLIVKFGLKQINSSIVRVGLKELIDVSNRNKTSLKELKSSDIAFRIAPRINATGRLSNAKKSFDLLVTENAVEARKLAEELDNENINRQELCDIIIAQARDMLINYDLSNHKIIILHNEKWHGGVLGIAASKISEEFNRPTILLTNTNEHILKGSGRSIKGINLFNVLLSCSPYLIQFGGHSMAAGLSIKTENITNLISSCDKFLTDNYDKSIFSLVIDYDIAISLKELCVKEAKELALFEPYGLGNKKPIFMVKAEKLSFAAIGQKPHIKYKINEDVVIIGFNYISYLELLNSKLEKNIFFSQEIDSFNNKEYVNCIIKNIQLINFDVSREILSLCDLNRYLSTNNIVSINREKIFKPNTLYGTICLAWSKNTFDYFINQYPEYQIEYSTLPSKFPYNTILFSPDKEVFLGYYSKIIIGDNPPNHYVRNIINNYKVEVEVLNNPQNSNYSPRISKDNLTNLYFYLINNLSNINFTNFDSLYKTLTLKGLKLDIYIFKLCVIILMELKIIDFDINNKIIINKQYNSLNNSQVFKLMGCE